MAYDYRDLLTNVETILAATSTVSTLVASMTVDYPITSDNISNRISLGDPHNLPTFVGEYPRAFIHLVSKEEEFANIGISSTGISRDITTNINMYAFIYKQEGSDESDKQVQLFARNIETIFRSQVSTVNASWDTFIIGKVDFADAYLEGGSKASKSFVKDVWLSAARLEASFKKFSVT